MKQKLFKLLLTTMCIALIVVLTGWYTDAKQVIHSMLISCMVFAFLPFCIILAIAAVLVLLSFILMIIGFYLGGEVGAEAGDLVGQPLGEATLKHTFSWISPYYEFITKQRHPIFWGIPAGILSGTIILWSLISFIQVPKEIESVNHMAIAQAYIDEYYKSNKKFPASNNEQPLIDGEVAKDGFRNLLEYRLEGKWKFKTWTLISRGIDGVSSKDDLCLSGVSKEKQKLDGYLAKANKLLNKVNQGDSRVANSLKCLEQLKMCS